MVYLLFPNKTPTNATIIEPECAYNTVNSNLRLKMDVDIQAVESKLSDVTVTAIPLNNKGQPVTPTPKDNKDPNQSKYAQLLGVIEELGREVRPTYAGSRSSSERLKRGIVHAKFLVRECLMETERSARQ